MVNGKESNVLTTRGEYAEVNRKWSAGDEITVILPMTAKLLESNPLVEENRNQVAVKRGPVVYCLESVDLPKDTKLLISQFQQILAYTIYEFKLGQVTGLVIRVAAEVFNDFCV